VLIMTMAVRNGCHLCVAMHTAKLHELDADPENSRDRRAGLRGRRRFVDQGQNVARGDQQATFCP